MQSMYVYMSIFVSAYFFEGNQNCNGNIYIKIRNSTFYPEQVSCQKILPIPFFMLKPRILYTIFTIILCFSIHMAVLVCNTSVCSLVRILLL